MSWILALTLLISSTSWAAESCTDLEHGVSEEFKKVFYNEIHSYDYFDGWCSQNIMNLSKHLIALNLNLDDADVIYLFRREGDESVWPQASRGWTGDGWSFHVILNYKGLVLDLDYTPTPHPLPLKEYLEKMFWSSPENSNILIKVVPASQFPSIYAGKFAAYPRTFIRTETDAQFPPQALESYVNAFQSKACQ